MHNSIAQNKPELSGIPETLLWPLWNRAMEQKNKNSILDDPMSLDLLSRLDYDFRGSFGKPDAGHAIRARVIDDALKEWLVEHPSGPVVSLGEGLDSQFWRVDNGLVNWISVDLPESVGLREKMLPAEPRLKHVPCSALDPAWMEEVPKDKPVFIVLAGLLMYFTKTEVGDLMRRIGDRFPGSRLIFDVIPQWLSRKTLKGHYVTKSYRAPEMPWGLNYGDADKLLSFHPAYRIRHRMTYADPFPERMLPYSLLAKIPWARNNLAPWMVHMEISAPG